MAETFADLLREVGIEDNPGYTPGPYRPGYRPGAELPAYTPPRARPQGGSYAQERQFRMEGARDRFLRRGDLGAAGELALDMTGLPALAQAGRAFRAGDAQSGVTEGATGALQLAGTLSPLPNRGLFGRRLNGPPVNVTPADRVASEFADAAKRRIPLAERGFAGVQPAEESTLEDWWRLVDQSQPERATLGLSDLTATQDSVSDNFAAVAAANQGRRPVVIEEGGRRYIIDGHHRALAAPGGRLDVDLYRSNWTPPGEAAPQPQAMPRLLGRASDGSVLPMREPQPFRRTAATSADLVEAARHPSRSGESDLLAAPQRNIPPPGSRGAPPPHPPQVNARVPATQRYEPRVRSDQTPPNLPPREGIFSSDETSRPRARIEPLSGGYYALHAPTGGGEFHGSRPAAVRSAQRHGWEVDPLPHHGAPTSMQTQLRQRIANQRLHDMTNAEEARIIGLDEGLSAPPPMAGINDLATLSLRDAAAGGDGRVLRELLDGELGPFSLAGRGAQGPLLGISGLALPAGAEVARRRRGQRQ